MASNRPVGGLRWPGATAAMRFLSQTTPGDVLSILEVLTTENPEVVPIAVANLASSPARPALLELAPLFQVEAPEEIAVAALTVARQLDRLERHPSWTKPHEVLGDASSSAIALDAFARRRAERWLNHRGRVRPPKLVRVDRLLREAAELERARSLVEGLLK